MLRRVPLWRCCVKALAVPTSDAAFWTKYKAPGSGDLLRDSAIAKDFFAAQPSDQHRELFREIVHPSSFVALECFTDPKHASDITTALAAMQRWTELDQNDAVTQILAHSPKAQENLVGALVCHQRTSTLFVAHAARAIANCALLVNEENEQQQQQQQQQEKKDDEISPSVAPVATTKFASSEVITILLQTLLRDDVVTVESGRGVAWILQALQNLILKDETAAQHCCRFTSTGATGSNDGTAEHVIAVAVRRILRAFRETDKQQLSSDPQEAVTAVQRRIVAVDSGLACIARLLTMSSEQAGKQSSNKDGKDAGGGEEVETLHRLEHASADIFDAVAEALNSELAPLSVELQHKAWECLRHLVVGCADNVAPLLSSLHAADGQSGFRILNTWLGETAEDLSSCCFELAVADGSSSGESVAQRHEKRMRMQCGFAVLIELTGASIFNNTGGSASSSSDNVDQQQDEDGGGEASLEQEATVKTSVSEYDPQTRRIDSAVQAITGGTLSKFAVKVLHSLHEAKSNNSNNNTINTEVCDMTIGQSLQLLLNLSQSDPYVRSANCIAVLQRAVFAPTLALKTATANDAAHCQRAMSVVWNALNFRDAAAAIKEMAVEADVAKIVAAQKAKLDDVDLVMEDAETLARRQLQVAGEKLLEKMKAVL